MVLNIMVDDSKLSELKNVLSMYRVNNNNSCICTDVHNTEKNTVFITIYTDIDSDPIYWDWYAISERVESIEGVRCYIEDGDDYTIPCFNCSMWYAMIKNGICVKNCITTETRDRFKPLF